MGLSVATVQKGTVTELDVARPQGKWSHVHPTHDAFLLSLGDGTILFCRNCGQYMQQRCVGLKQSCSKKPADSLTALRRRRMINGSHPLDVKAKF